jgi:bifunctional non-homologous end joining protein LigD
MSIDKYKEKRNFTKTSEPGAVKKSSRHSLAFVVQKHAASRLHYDFRLELDGVLKSWAVPKGPSLNPSVKRLAMMVEDHPYDYKDFEGVIPKGEYGAGEVIIWDKGTYHAIGTTDKSESEDIIRKGLLKGDLKFVLNGEKLKGEFVLVNMKTGGENQWLLIKHKDEYVSKTDITIQDQSVVSGLTLDDIAKGDLKKKSGQETN